MKRIIVIVFALVLLVSSAYAFQIQQYGYEFRGFFIELYTLDYLPTVFTDKTDGFIDIKVYDLDHEDLTGAITIADVKISGEPLYSTRQTVREKQRLSIPKDRMEGLRLVVVSSQSRVAKVMTSYRTVGAQLLTYDDGAMLRLWSRDDSRFINEFSLYRLLDGSLLGRTENGLFTFEKLPASEETILIQSPSGSLLWKPNEYDYDLPSKYISMTFTDRPAYKAGETVNFRAFVREITPEGYIIPGITEIEVEITDPLSRSVFREKMDPDSLGSVNGSFKTYADITRGSYRIIVRWEEKEDYYYFQIADYKKPTFFTTASPTSNVFTRGEEVSINVKSEYYFGDPVALGKVDYTIYRGGQYIDNGASRLDVMGETVIGYVSDLEAGYYYAVITVSDDTGMQSRTTVDFRITLGSFSFITDYKLNDHQLIASIETKLNNDTPVSKEFELKVWYEESVTVVDSGKAVEKKIRINAFRKTVMTDSGGKLEIVIDLSSVPDNTLVYVELNGAPSGEPEVVAKSSVYLSGYYDYYGSLILDSIKSASPGSKAEVSFYTSSEMDLWIIADFSGSFSQFTFNTVPGKNTVEVMVPEEYAYESFGIYFVSFKEYPLYYNWLVGVDRPKNEYTVKLLTQDRYGPGDQVNLRIQVTDSEGEPAIVGLTVAAVSQAMLSLFEGDQDLWKSSLKNPFYRGFNSVRLSDLYYNPYPSIAKLNDILESRPPAAESKVLSREAFGMGDLGGGEFESLTSDVKARKLFSDSALWSVGSFTDENGLAEISFTLPEDLDTWTVRALTADEKGGFSYARSSFETWKPMTVSSFLPEFVIAGDTVQFVFSVKNNTDSPMPILSGFFRDEKVIEEKGSVVPAFESMTFRYDIEVDELSPDRRSELLKVKFVVEGSRASDGVEYEIPVKPRFTYRRFGELTFLDGKRTLEFDESSVGWVTVTSTIDPILLEAIRYLVDYPYGCVEQTMSRLLPALAASRLLEKADQAFVERVIVVTEKGLNRLYGFQHYDGGWGWWKDDQSSPFMTAYVMYGFHLAIENGFSINEDVLRYGYSAMKTLYRNSPDPFLQYVIALHSRRMKDSIGTFVEYKKDVASLVLSSLTARLFNFTDRANSLMEEALGLVSLDEERVIKGSSFNYFFDETVTLSFLLQAALETGTSQETVSNISKKLLTMGNGSYWYRTASTAIAVVSLSYLSSSLSKDAVITFETLEGEQLEVMSDHESTSIEIRGESFVINTTGLVAVSVNGETALPAESVEHFESGLKLERILRRKETVPYDDGFILTTPQLDSPFAVSSVKTLAPQEIGNLEIDAYRYLDGLEISIKDGELMLGKYHLGLRVYDGEVIGSTEKGFIIKSVEYDYYEAETVEIFVISLSTQSALRVGETIISEVRIEIPETAPYIVLEDMLPATGIAIEENLEGGMLGYSKFYYFDNYWWGYSFREERFDRVAYFFRYGGYFTTKTTWRILTKGEFLIPAVQAWAMYDDDYSANSVATILRVE